MEVFLQDCLQYFDSFEFISPKEFIIKFPADVHVFIGHNIKETNISSENIWKNDKISPSADILNYELPITFLICDACVIWSLNNTEIALKSLSEETSLFSTNGCQFFHLWSHFNVNTDDYDENNDLDKNDENIENENLFTCETLPYIFQKIVNFCLKTLRYNVCIAQNQININKSEKNERKSFVEHYKENNEMGTFIAFEDRMVKCCFSDRTMVTINDNENLVMILTKKGERIVQSINEKNEFSQ